MIVLGIETSCDETAVGIVEDGQSVLANVIASQANLHQSFGGVVPEVAARQHTEAIIPTIKAALLKASVTIEDLDAVAVTSSHGLVGCLTVGVGVAKSLAYVLEIPLIGVHHIEGHIFANRLHDPDLRPPFLCLTVSGGHSMLVLVEDEWRYRVVGDTIDDSAGEAFDKTARLLGLSFPGGPVIDRLSSQGDADAFPFPRPLERAKSYDFSFSGLKTAVKKTVEGLMGTVEGVPTEDVAASVQEAIVAVLVKKSLQAALDLGVDRFAVTGGVAANSRLRALLSEHASRRDLRLTMPAKDLCTDNGAMVACAGFYRLRAGFLSSFHLDARASAPVGET